MTQRGTDRHRLPVRDLAAAVTSSVITALPAFLVAALAVQIGGSLSLGAQRLGFVVALFYCTAALSSVPLGRLTERVGALRAMRAGCVLAAVVVAGVGLLVRGWTGLAVAMVFAGAAGALVQPATNHFLLRRMPAARQGVAFGLKQASVPLATLLGGLAVPTIALTVGWRWAFGAAAVLSLVAAVTLPRPPRSLAENRRRIAGPLPGGRSKLVLLAAGMCFGASAASGMAYFIVSAAVHAGAGEGVAGLVAVLGGGCAIATRVGAGAVVDRNAVQPGSVLRVMLAVGVIGYLVLAWASTGHPALLIPGVVLGFAGGWGWNGLFNLMVSRQYPRVAVRATAMTAVGGRAGGVIGPAGCGVLVSYASFTVAWVAAAASACVGLGCIELARRMLRASGAGLATAGAVPAGPGAAPPPE